MTFDMDENIPPPPQLVRQSAYCPDAKEDIEGPDQGMIDRYLQYEINYSDLLQQYKGLTWGALIVENYHHFVYLMAHSVAKDSNTFLALKGHLQPADREFAQKTTRTRDTQEGKQKTMDKYLQITCSHKGAMNGKTWHEIREKNYSYFVWSVGNVMGRDTKSFAVLVNCLNVKDQEMVKATEKGEVVAHKYKKYKAVL
jgi:hypothetical protein